MLFDGYGEAALERLTGSPRVALYDEIPSTLDVLHALAADGAPPGTLVLAEVQTAGRGRQGRRWESPRGAGVWMSVLLRPGSAPAGGALAIRAALAIVEALASLAPALGPRLKWPNDVMVAGRKAGGILCEARWSGESLGWIAVGIGLNVRGPVEAALRDRAIALGDVAKGIERPAVLAAIVPRIIALQHGPAELSAATQACFLASRWPASDKSVSGLAPDGALLVRGSDGTIARRTDAD
jgi:BirA family biotin operon repressor/biotin-[acetyl-CoA-carboxylase] ligase